MNQSEKLKADKSSYGSGVRMLLSLLAASVLGGCAVMNKEDCLQSDWYELGRRDVLKGTYRLEERRQVCAEHGIGIDPTGYDRGALEGLRAFCTTTSGQAHGDAGNSYERGFCPTHSEDAFLQGYLPAIERYNYRQRIKDLQQQIDGRHRDLQKELHRQDGNKKKIDVIRGDIRRLEQQLQREMIFTRPN